MDRQSADLIRNLLLRDIHALRVTDGIPRSDFSIALRTFEEEVDNFTGLDNSSPDVTDSDDEWERVDVPQVDLHISDNSESGADSSITLVAFDCVACQETRTMFDLVHLPCSHQYCNRCLSITIAWSLRDNAPFPPRCCGTEISIVPFEDIIGRDLAARVEEKSMEMKDPNRTYCAINACSRYIPAANIFENRGRCSSCRGETCIRCKMPYHLGRCVVAQEELFEMARNQKWQRCCKCHAMVEKRGGCYHMVCRCGQGFCYNCGQPWRQSAHECSYSLREDIAE